MNEQTTRLQISLATVRQYKKELAGIGIIALTLGGGFFGWQWYTYRQQQAAHKTLVSCLKAFEGNVVPKAEQKIMLDQEQQFTSEEEKWLHVDRVFKEGYQQHQHTSLASMFLVFASEALIWQGKTAQAIELLQKAIEGMPSQSLKPIYQVKLSLLEMAQKKEPVADKEAAFITRLKSIANEEHNHAKDVALYHLGNYFWHRKNFDQARNYWNRLKLKFGQGTEYPSPWFSEIKNKLKLLQ